MSDTSNLDFIPAEPLPPAEGIYDSLPEDVVKSVLERSGFKDSQSQESEDGTSSQIASPGEESPVEPQEDVALPEAPGGPLFAAEPAAPAEPAEGEEEDPEGSVRLPDGRLLPLALVQQWANAQDRPAPPSLPQPPVATPAQPLPPAPGPPPFQLPPISQEELENASQLERALLMLASAQANQLREVREQQATIAAQVVQRQRQENAELANSAATSFQRQYNLPDDLMTKVKNSVEASDLDAYLSRDPDPYKAVEYALQRSYWNSPEARQYEFERQTSARNAAQSRKRKLAGINGSGGSGPRGAPAIDESTPEGMKAAAVELARAAMYGDQQ